MALGSLAFLLPARAQEGYAYVSPALPNDPNLAKVTMFRLWYVGGESSPSIALVREAKGKNPIYLEGGLAAGLYSPYVPIQPGQCDLHIIDGAVRPPSTPEGKLPLEEKKLMKPLALDFKPGTFVTLLIREQNGALSGVLEEDKRPGKGAPPVMSVKDFSGLDSWSIRLLGAGDKPGPELWNSKVGSTQEPIRLPGEGVFRIQVSRDIDGKSWPLGLFEAKLNSAAPFTIILNGGGQNNTGSCGLSFDAAPNGDISAYIKSVADSVGKQPDQQ